MGGLQAAFISTMNHMKYAGVCLAVPYFAMKDPKLLDSIRPVVKTMAKVTPNKSIQIFDHTKAKRHLREWYNEPANQLGSYVSPHNVIQNDLAMQKTKTDKLFEKMTPPTLILRCGLDKVVDNKAIQEYFETIPQPDK